MRIRTIALVGLAGAVAAYLFDPIDGSARRSRLRRRMAAFIHRRRIPVGSLAPLPENMIPPPRAAITDMPGEPSENVTDGSEDDTIDDPGIAERIRMEVLGRPDLETEGLVVDVVHGVAFLRGVMKDRQAIEEIADLTRSVPGVQGVQNLIVIRIPEIEATSRPETGSLGEAWNA